MNLLLHTCCAPCASHCVLTLRELGHTVTLFYANANIAPHAEFRRRLESVERLADRLAVPLLVEAPDHADWLARAACGLEGARERGPRCARCFRYSLCRTAELMRQRGFDGFTTSLSVSPHKRTATLFEAGRAVDAGRFLAIDFKKNDGFLRSLRLASEFGLYRQSYCGCEFSQKDTSRPVEEQGGIMG